MFDVQLCLSLWCILWRVLYFFLMFLFLPFLVAFVSFLTYNFLCVCVCTCCQITLNLFLSGNVCFGKALKNKRSITEWKQKQQEKENKSLGNLIMELSFLPLCCVSFKYLNVKLKTRNECYSMMAFNIYSTLELAFLYWNKKVCYFFIIFPPPTCNWRRGSKSGCFWKIIYSLHFWFLQHTEYRKKGKRCLRCGFYNF